MFILQFNSVAVFDGKGGTKNFNVSAVATDPKYNTAGKTKEQINQLTRQLFGDTGRAQQNPEVQRLHDELLASAKEQNSLEAKAAESRGKVESLTAKREAASQSVAQARGDTNAQQATISSLEASMPPETISGGGQGQDGQAQQVPNPAFKQAKAALDQAKAKLEECRMKEQEEENKLRQASADQEAANQELQNAQKAVDGNNSKIGDIAQKLGQAMADIGDDPLGKNGGFGGGNPVGGAGAGDPAGGVGAGDPAAGGGNGEKPPIGNGLGYLAAARAILKAIALVTMQHISAHPIPNIAKAETNEKLARLAISYLDAAQVDSALNGTVANQEIIFTKTQASTIEGDAKTAKSYWTTALNNDKQDNKDTHKLADRA